MLLDFNGGHPADLLVAPAVRLCCDTARELGLIALRLVESHTGGEPRPAFSCVGQLVSARMARMVGPCVRVRDAVLTGFPLPQLAALRSRFENVSGGRCFHVQIWPRCPFCGVLAESGAEGVDLATYYAARNKARRLSAENEQLTRCVSELRAKLAQLELIEKSQLLGSIRVLRAACATARVGMADVLALALDPDTDFKEKSVSPKLLEGTSSETYRGL